MASRWTEPPFGEGFRGGWAFLFSLLWAQSDVQCCILQIQYRWSPLCQQMSASVRKVWGSHRTWQGEVSRCPLSDTSSLSSKIFAVILLHFDLHVLGIFLLCFLSVHVDEVILWSLLLSSKPVVLLFIQRKTSMSSCLYAITKKSFVACNYLNYSLVVIAFTQRTIAYSSSTDLWENRTGPHPMQPLLLLLQPASVVRGKQY